MTHNTTRRLVSILIWILLLCSMVLGQAQQQREYQRWGKFGVGKLVTTHNNLNCIADGQLRWAQWAHLPAMEYPYNPEPGGRHVNYAVGISFHIGGFCADYGPSFDPAQSDAGDDPIATARVESGDRTYYRYYDGFHYESFRDFVAEKDNSGVAVSTDSTTWPQNGWPDIYPTHDEYHDLRFPEYENVFQLGLVSPYPLLKDSVTGFPGSGPNGEVLADQESFAVNFSINRLPPYESPDINDGKLMVHTSLRGLSYSGDFYDDFLIYIWTVTNVSPEPITKAHLGMLVDFDFPWATYQSYSSYNRTDCYAFDKQYDMAYGWDGDGTVPGAVYGDWTYPVKAKLTDESVVDNPALAGVMFLKTPMNDSNEEELGSTSFDAFHFRLKDSEYGIGSSHYEFYWNNIANDHYSNGSPGWDPDDLNHDRIDDWTWENPFPLGTENIYVKGYKCEFTINTGPFTLKPGETDTLIVAVVMGTTRDALFKNAGFARQLFDAGFKPLKPPKEPLLRAKEGSGTVELIWDSRSEDDSLNAEEERQPFEGYKLYRSTDGGQTWGTRIITDENGTIVDYVPLGQWDLTNGISGQSKIMPTFNLGTDSGLDEIIEITDRDTTIIEIIAGDTIFYGKFSAGDTTGRRIYQDNNVVDGFKYRYALVAYSADGEGGIPPVQNPKNVGAQDLKDVPHVISVVPHAKIAEHKSELDLIRVVPNPYRVFAEWELSQDERMIKFTHLPAVCTIKILNAAGELMQTLEHSHGSPISSEEIWNLRTSENREVAPGLYFYYISSTLGEKAGKFVIIK